MSGAEAIPAVSALWLGILTSISPCPLATNLAALTFVSRQLATPGRVVLSGVFYTVGRALAYLVIAVVVVSGLFSMPAVSAFLQHTQPSSDGGDGRMRR